MRGKKGLCSEKSWRTYTINLLLHLPLTFLAVARVLKNTASCASWHLKNIWTCWEREEMLLHIILKGLLPMGQKFS